MRRKRTSNNTATKTAFAAPRATAVEWWQPRQKVFPHLAVLAEAILAVQATSARGISRRITLSYGGISRHIMAGYPAIFLEAAGYPAV